MTAGQPPVGDGAGTLSGAALPARSRGVIGLLEENCTVCMLCARECPDWCIYIDSHKEPVPAGPAAAGPATAGRVPAEPVPAETVPGAAAARPGRSRVRNVLDRFAIDFSLCMYCGICIEVCPYDALFWSPEFAYPAVEITELTHERSRLREWMWTVPPPPAHDAGAPPPREVLAAGAAVAETATGRHGGAAAEETGPEPHGGATGS
jgi:NADH-quinone oxidoreductase subunit I